MSESLCLKTIYELRVDASDDSFRYYIPAYQRGYKLRSIRIEVVHFISGSALQQPGFGSANYLLFAGAMSILRIWSSTSRDRSGIR